MNTDFYYKGQNPFGFTNASKDGYTTVTFETTYIYVGISTSSANTAFIKANRSFNFAPYSNIYLEMTVTRSSTVPTVGFLLNRNTIDYTNKIMKVGASPLNTGARTITFNITNYRTTYTPVIGFELHGGAVNVNRIRVA